jgi:hypothetical protein
MQRFTPIANEAEFQEWLLLVLQAERMRLQEQIVAHHLRVNCPSKTKFDWQSEEPHESTREK